MLRGLSPAPDSDSYESLCQQVTGFCARDLGETFTHLLRSAACTQEEWDRIKKEHDWMSSNLIEEGDEYFESK